MSYYSIWGASPQTACCSLHIPQRCRSRGPCTLRLCRTLLSPQPLALQSPVGSGDTVPQSTHYATLQQQPPQRAQTTHAVAGSSAKECAPTKCISAHVS